MTKPNSSMPLRGSRDNQRIIWVLTGGGIGSALLYLVRVPPSVIICADVIAAFFLALQVVKPRTSGPPRVRVTPIAARFIIIPAIMAAVGFLGLLVGIEGLPLFAAVIGIFLVSNFVYACWFGGS